MLVFARFRFQVWRVCDLAVQLGSGLCSMTSPVEQR